jgi:hypothetical protein
MGFRYRLAFATRAFLAAAAALAFWRGQPIGGGIVLVLFLTYLLQIPLIVGIALGDRSTRRRRGG